MTTQPPPMIVIHDADGARAALAAARALGRRVTLLSPPATSAALGPGVFAESVAAGAEDAAPVEALYDCADQAGLAMAALRRGGLDVVVDLPAETAAKIAELARARGRRAYAPGDLDGRAVLDLNAEFASGRAEARVTRFLEDHPQ